MISEIFGLRTTGRRFLDVLQMILQNYGVHFGRMWLEKNNMGFVQERLRLLVIRYQDCR